jgi:hypothetical protein
LECFFSLPHRSVKTEKTFYLCPSQKKGVGRRNNNSFGVRDGTVMTSGEYLQTGVRQGLPVIHKSQRKVHPNQLGPSEEKIKKEFPSISLRFYKYFSVSVGTLLVCVGIY